MGDQYDKCFDRGQRHGYEGQKLEEYIEKRIVESYNREERLRKLELARKVSERREHQFATDAEKRKAEAKNRRTKADKRKVEAEEHERKHVCMREESEEEEARHEREHKRLVELLQMRQETGLNHDATPTHSDAKASRPKLPSFDEQRDDIDAYLERFERFAKS